MGDRLTADQAIELLAEEIERMKKVRNATPRDPRFIEWRQAALTVVQRIWPNQPRRWQRFRRVPFSPPAPSADARVVRAHYERGHSEVRRLLKVWIAEIKTNGLEGSAEAPEVKVEEAPKPHTESAKQDGRLKDMLGLGHLDHEHDSESGHSKSGVKGGKTHGFTSDLGQSISEALASAEGEPPHGGSGKGHKHSHPRHSGPKSSAHTLAALADELEKLGVPHEERRSVTSSLVQVSMRMDSGSLTWKTLQDAVVLLMQYPALARRALPLLLPFLDRAA